jgi:hypothetical protein
MSNQKPPKKFGLLRKWLHRYREAEKQRNYAKQGKKLGFFNRKIRKVLLYPDKPSYWNAIRAMLNVMNYQITYDINDDFHFAIYWHDTTFKEADEQIRSIAKEKLVLNMNSTDISKFRVDKLMQEVFGYCTVIDPLTFQGKCVKKSDANSAHDGQIIECPIEKIEEGYIYQIAIDTQVDERLVEDIRVIFVKDHIPFVYVKYKLIENKFLSKTVSATTLAPRYVFSDEEITKIITVCQKMCLDFAELDVLRDRVNGKIYIVDINDTPGGFPKKKGGRELFSMKERLHLLSKLALAFQKSFSIN